jgi:hypothetical protein
MLEALPINAQKGYKGGDMIVCTATENLIDSDFEVTQTNAASGHVLGVE